MVALGQAAARPGAAGDDEMMEKGPVGDEWVRVGGLGAMYLMWVAWGQSDAAQAYADVRAGLRAAGRVLQVIEARIIVVVGLCDRGVWGQAKERGVEGRVGWVCGIVGCGGKHCYRSCDSHGCTGVGHGVGHVLVLVTYWCWSRIGVGHVSVLVTGFVFLLSSRPGTVG